MILKTNQTEFPNYISSENNWVAGSQRAHVPNVPKTLSYLYSYLLYTNAASAEQCSVDNFLIYMDTDSQIIEKNIFHFTLKLNNWF